MDRRNTQRHSYLKLAVFIEQHAIDQNFAVAAHVADKVPVNRRVIFAARLGIARTDGHVDRAADLFIVENTFGEALNLIIGADGKFA